MKVKSFAKNVGTFEPGRLSKNEGVINNDSSESTDQNDATGVARG